MGGRLCDPRCARSSPSPFWDYSKLPRRSASAQSYPTRPITLIVPYPAGGPSDTLARVMAERLKTALGQIGRRRERHRRRRQHRHRPRRARGARRLHARHRPQPDPCHQRRDRMNLPYDVVKDFEPVTLIADTPQWLDHRRKTLPANDVKEFDRLAQAAGQQGDLGRGRRRRPDRHRRAVVPAADRHAIPVRALSRRRAAAAGLARAARSTSRSARRRIICGHVRSGQLKAFAVLTHEALVGGARRADHGRSRRAGTSTPRSGTASGRRRARRRRSSPSSTPRSSRRWPTRRCRSASRTSARRSGPRDKQTPAALAAQQKAEIERMVAGHQGRQASRRE